MILGMHSANSYASLHSRVRSEMDVQLQDQPHLAYLQKIFDSIRKNAETIGCNDEKKQLVKRANEFYKSLFSPKSKGTQKTSPSCLLHCLVDFIVLLFLFVFYSITCIYYILYVENYSKYFKMFC